MKEIPRTLGSAIDYALENTIPLSEILKTVSDFAEIIKSRNLDAKSVIVGMDLVITAMSKCNDGEKYNFSQLVDTLSLAMINSVIAENYVQGKYDKYIK